MNLVNFWNCLRGDTQWTIERLEEDSMFGMVRGVTSADRDSMG